jgi:diguanylate cyclase (GGDEF)-like protein/PAS domain S-box-containing protein
MRLAFLLPRRRIPLHVGIVAAVLAVCLLLVGLDGWRTWQARAAAIADDKVETANLARSLAQHAHDIVHVADMTVSGVRERVETDGVSPDQVGRLNRFIALRMAEVPALRGLEVFDAAGDRVTGERDAARHPVNVADHACFEFHRTHADRGVHVGEIIRARGDGQWSITVSRRLDAADGRFAGVAMARISVAFLQDFYHSFAVGYDGLITLTSMKGTIVARTDGTRSSVGADISAGTIFREVATGQPMGSFRYVSVLDGVERLGSFRTLDDYPLFIIVAHGLDEVLAGWRADSRLHLAVSLCVAAALAVAGRRFARQVRIGQRAERRYRLLAENSSDAIVCMGLDGSRRYASPAFTALTGWSVEEGVCGRWADIIHPDNRQMLAGVVPRLLSGEAQVTSCFRYIRKDGSAVWVEGRARLLRDISGDTQVISNVRDITDRRAAEDQVAVLNQELARQANTDGLTGLANRRRFDEALDLEWRRGAREETPLSLLMIDVDRFKPYNDRHGHQGGDACLRAVAAAMAQVARRPADLTARYGGEEFAILLPGVDAQGAAALAARVLAAVRATGIAHEDNTPAGVATVSIGAATAIPSMAMEAPGLAALVAGVDAALYEAKRSGRNRVVAQAGTAFVDVPGAAVPA